MTFKPMLAGKSPEDLTALPFPVLVSPKLDGIRCVIRDGLAMSRKLKPIPNAFVQAELDGLPAGLDGELMVDGGFNACQSAFMSADGDPDFLFWVFDIDLPGQQLGYEERYHHLIGLYGHEQERGQLRHPRIVVVQHTLCDTPEEVLALEREYLDAGFEGAMIRSIDGPYKYGRSTTKQGFLTKLKRFTDEEAEIIGVEERMHNENELETDELGHAKRSHAKAGMVPAGDMGKLLCRTPDGAEFGIGSGFTQQQREVLWEQRETLIGCTLTFKHQPDPGGRQPGQAPRFPVFLGLRHDL